MPCPLYQAVHTQIRGPSPSTTNEYCMKLLKDLNPHKAQGPDAIPSRFLKEFAEEIAPARTLVYQASVQQRTIPDDWKKSPRHTDI